MKLLYIVSLYPCWSETFIVREIAYLRKQNIDVQILSLRGDQEEFVQEDAIEGITSVVYTKGFFYQIVSLLKYFIVHPVIISAWFFRIIKTFWRSPTTLMKNVATIMRTLTVVNELRENEHIHAHWATYPSTSAMLLSQITSIPYSFMSHAHDIFLEDHFISEKINNSKFSSTISNFNVKLLSDLKNVNADKLKIIHCGIEPNEYALKNSNKNYSILSVGRMDEIKGFEYLVKAIKLLKDEGMDITCNIIGSGELKDNIVSLTNELGLQDVIKFHGAKEQKEVREMMCASQMFVLPSVVTSEGNMDGIPVVLMESMALGTPVISTYVSGIPELIEDKVNGLLVQQKSPEELSVAIQTILNMDEEDRSKIINNARETIESSFNINIEAQNLLDLIKE